MVKIKVVQVLVSQNYPHHGAISCCVDDEGRAWIKTPGGEWSQCLDLPDEPEDKKTSPADFKASTVDGVLDYCAQHFGTVGRRAKYQPTAKAAIERLIAQADSAARFDEARKALDVAVNHSMDLGQDIANVLAKRIADLKRQQKADDEY